MPKPLDKKAMKLRASVLFCLSGQFYSFIAERVKGTTLPKNAKNDFFAHYLSIWYFSRGFSH